MCNNDCLVKLDTEKSFLVKFGIFAPQINFLFYSIQSNNLIVETLERWVNKHMVGFSI